MELVIYSPETEWSVSEIKWNYEEIKAEVAAKMEQYKGLVYGENEIKFAKQDRADMNKFVAAIENERKSIKKKCMAAYEQFERQVKEVIALVNEPIALIDSRIKEVEEAEKKEKFKAITELFDRMNDIEEIELSIISVFCDRWLNKSVSMTQIENEIQEELERFRSEIKTIKSLPEFSFEAMEVYKDKRNLSVAIEEGMRLAEIQKRKEAAKAAEAPEVETSVYYTTATEEPIPPMDAPRSWQTFRAQLTVEDAKALRAFFESRNINYEVI